MEQSIFVNWRERIRFGENGPAPQILADDGEVRVILGGLKAGQSIPVHAESRAVYQFLEGEGQMTVDDRQVPISPGVIVVVAQGAKRGMTAATQLAFLAVRVDQEAAQG